MKSFAVIYFGLLASRGLGNAQSTSCTADVAIPFSVPGGANNDVSTDTSGAVGAGQDDLNQGSSNGEQGVGQAAGQAGGTAQDDLNQAAGSGDESTDQAVQDAKDYFAQAAADNSKGLARRRLNKRADFSCASDETCYIVNNGLFCVNGKTGIYHEPDGSVGSIITGNYTLTDGQKGNIYTGPVPTLSSGVPSVTKTPSLSASASSKPATDDETSSTATSAEASPTSTSAEASLSSTSVESRLSSSASATSKASLVGSRTSSTPQTGTSTSTPSSAPGNGASSLQSPNIQFATMTSIMAGFLLWGIYVF